MTAQAKSTVVVLGMEKMAPDTELVMISTTNLQRATDHFFPNKKGNH